MAQREFEIGDLVTVKCYGGSCRLNVVWEFGERVVYVCSRRQYRELKQGRKAPPPIGFPVVDVQLSKR